MKSNGSASVRRGKVRPKRSVTLRLAFAMIVSFVLLPLLYLQYHLLRVIDLRHEKTRQLSNEQRDIVWSQANRRQQKSGSKGGMTRITSAILEPPTTITYTPRGEKEPYFSRNISASITESVEFPNVDCDSVIPDLPIDNFPTKDPFLPWLHDYFVSEDFQHIRFVAQNKRRCDTGKDNIDVMAFWEPQVTLFQPIPVVQEGNRFRLAASMEEATHPATRFQCVFSHDDEKKSIVTLSEFGFDYEYVTWRKLGRPMIDRRGGKDTAMFWLSTLLFSCPIPQQWQHYLWHSHQSSPLYLDLVPIRTPIRTDEVLLTANHTGPDEFAKFQSRLFPLEKSFGRESYLPDTQNAGRWKNLPICPRPREEEQQLRIQGDDSSGSRAESKPSYQFVACTWTAASYSRRGDVVGINDSASRLREWILFHLMVGVEHLYVYDNTDVGNSTRPTELWYVTQEFSPQQVTYHPWPCKICNNNRPANVNPGERSSQYAAEASCRERYGPFTEWMTFLDVDEYLVPMKKAPSENSYHWGSILNDMKSKGIPLLQFRSSRARPRVETLRVLDDQSTCMDPSGPRKNDKFPNTDPCIGQKESTTFLETYNCEYIRSPKPQRFERARKQIYQSDYVLSHFVHYSTVTKDYAETYSEFLARKTGERYLSRSSGSQWSKRHPDYFVDEMTTGVLIHARSILPHETRRRSVECKVGSKVSCMLGYICDDSVAFSDQLHKDNLFTNSDGNYCNCWENSVVRDSLGPILKSKLDSHMLHTRR